MEHITVGQFFNEGKVAAVECVKNGSLTPIHIKDTCFLLILLTRGKLVFQIGDKQITAEAPAFVCFDETADPILVSKSAARYTCIYFHPQFLNINMSFSLLRSDHYDDIASVHDMFLLRPFLDQAYTVPMTSSLVEQVQHAADRMWTELTEQRDWYWSCRGRSYFMEIVIALERMYSRIAYDSVAEACTDLRHSKLRDAVLYVEGHYGESLTLLEIAARVGINLTSLTALAKEQLGCTMMEYLMAYRITVAKKQLAFTDVPIKEVAEMVGFKTVPHFCRVFKAHTNNTPAAFRKSAVQNRKKEML